MIIPNIFDDVEISNVLSLLIKTYNRKNGNSGSNSRSPKLISFFINNRLSHFKQLTKAVIKIQSIFDNAKIHNILRY